MKDAIIGLWIPYLAISLIIGAVGWAVYANINIGKAHNKALNDAINTCSPFKAHAFNKDITVCLSLDGYTVIENKETNE